jgi:hypothetical protein
MHEVLNALSGNWDPMPEYRMNEIMGGAESLGNNELLGSRIRSYIHLRNLAYNELVGSTITNAMFPLRSMISMAKGGILRSFPQARKRSR